MVNETRGDHQRSVSADTSNIANVPTLANGDTLWVNVTNDGTNLSIKMINSSSEPLQIDWDATSACWTKAVSGLGQQSGLFGFADASAAKVDNVTISSDDGGNWVTEHRETFTIDSNEERTEKIDYDYASNLIFDGVYHFTYDAWNRLVSVQKAYADDAGDMETPGRVWWTAEYDATGRRIQKTISGAGGWDSACHYYYDGHSMIETRNGSNQTIRQNVWGIRYVDDLVQTAVNTDYASNNTVDDHYYALQDANYNVVAIIDAAGVMVERYEYDPYGRRQVFIKGSADDEWLLAPMYASRRVGAEYQSDATNWTSTQEAWGLNEVGHQGLMHDEELGMIYNRARMLNVGLGRFNHRDWNPDGIYNDGGSLYQYALSNPKRFVDFNGQEAQIVPEPGDPADVPPTREEAEPELPAQADQNPRVRMRGNAPCERVVVMPTAGVCPAGFDSVHSFNDEENFLEWKRAGAKEFEKDKFRLKTTEFCIKCVNVGCKGCCSMEMVLSPIKDFLLDPKNMNDMLKAGWRGAIPAAGLSFKIYICTCSEVPR